MKAKKTSTLPALASTSATNTKNKLAIIKLKIEIERVVKLVKHFLKKKIKKRGKRRELFSIQNAIQLN